MRSASPGTMALLPCLNTEVVCRCSTSQQQHFYNIKVRHSINGVDAVIFLVAHTNLWNGRTAPKLKLPLPHFPVDAEQALAMQPPHRSSSSPSGSQSSLRYATPCRIRYRSSPAGFSLLAPPLRSPARLRRGLRTHIVEHFDTLVQYITTEIPT